MRGLQPPTHLLVAFVATAQFGSFTRAASALHLTQSAVSKQIRELERLTGVRLFERMRQRLVLTPSGARYEGAVRALLAQLESATLDLMTGQDGGGALGVSTLPTFGTRWLIPRLADFQARHPEVALNFVPYVHGYDFQRPELDCAIRYGEGEWPGAVADYLTGRDIVLIAAPGLAGTTRLAQPDDVLRHRWFLHTTVPQAWNTWCSLYGVKKPEVFPGIQLDQYHGIIRGVAAGMGLALVPRCLVEEDIAAGIVDTPFDAGYEDAAGYWLCYPESKVHHRPLGSFRAWILAHSIGQRSGTRDLRR